MIAIENLSKSYGGQSLFEDVSVKINSRERIGLVGRNGDGKTTLVRMIIGEETPDSGVISVPKNYCLGYVRQEIAFAEDTVLKEAMRGLPISENDQTWKAEKVLFGLGFCEKDLNRRPDEFSGGFQVRLNLAKVLVSEPDLILLDEPTNYLDITAIRWMERFLVSWPRELLLITHDRSFMDRVITHTLGIHRKKMRKIEGPTEKYYAQIAQEEEIHEKTRINDERRKKEIALFISRFRAKARLANMVQSRVKTLQKMRSLDKLEELKTLDFSFRTKPFSGKYVLRAEALSFGYPGHPELIRNLDLAIAAGERVCIVGPNGRGKTTLLKLLAGLLKPQSGKIACHPHAEKGFYEQTNIQSLVDSRSVEEEILYSFPDMDRQRARNICGAMMFEGDAALKKIAVLSGGEKSRVMLGKILASPVNFLLLDEPTNHLDMDSCDALLAAVDAFEGAVVIVTHNEMFLHALARRLVVFQDDSIRVFEGSYQDFLEKVGWTSEEACEKSDAPDAQPANKKNKKEMRRQRSEIIAQRSRALKPVETRIAQTEARIEQNESRIRGLNDAVMQAVESQDGRRIAELSKDIHGCERAIEALFDELEKLSEAHRAQQAEFDLKLSELDTLS